MFTLRKVGIIGCGHVGSHVAFSLATQGLVDELYMADCDKPKAFAQAMDVNDAVTYLPHHVVAHSCDVEDMTDCDIIVFCAGPLPGVNESRLASLPKTIEVLKDVVPRIQKSGFNGIIVSISNPADVVAAYIQKKLNWPKNRILSTGTGLDSSRLLRLLNETLGVNRRSIQAFAMGEHGGSCMVPWSFVKVGGKPLAELQKEKPELYPTFDQAKMVEDVKDGGYIVYRGKGSTEFGIASTCAEIIRAIFHNEHKVMPSSVLLEGEYGEEDVFTSVPVMLYAGGIEQIIEIEMTDEEKAQFHASNEIIRDYTKRALEM